VLPAPDRKEQVWFENAYSVIVKLALARTMHVGAVYLWLAGNEDDLMWRDLSAEAIDQVAAQMRRSGAPGGR
jgi:spore germination protein YaaH